ncbi:MAG: hypothetical protein JO322_07615 [Candidatus Eremiobacteraeota bacterium]|nr:hypothetical protein [Candidatus Eremiobacteraeota bacterium]
MITVRDDFRQDERPALVLSLVASVVINLLAWMLVIWGSAIQLHLRPAIEKPELIVSSSSIRIEHRTVPQPRSAQQQQLTRPQHASTPKRQQAPKQERVAPAQPEARPTELARLTPTGTPVPPAQRAKHEPASLAAQLAQQEQMFAREAQQLNASHSISIATNPPLPPSAYHEAPIDVSGREEQRESVEALLEPLPGQHWIKNGMSCYYVHYYAQYSGGGTEDGNIPWPLCYPADHDAMLPLNKTHRLPIPSPPAGYQLPPNVTLQPLLRMIYTGEIKSDDSDGNNGKT